MEQITVGLIIYRIHIRWTAIIATRTGSTEGRKISIPEAELLTYVGTSLYSTHELDTYVQYIYENSKLLIVI